uniref:Uncharacterized protein n=1 Tax=Megaselia scalaris TaxID=36166 RepID=T1GSL9_MEGSC
MFANHNNYLFVNDLSTNLAFDLLKFCAVERSDVTLYISLENPNFRCDELATIPMNALENIVFTLKNTRPSPLENSSTNSKNFKSIFEIFMNLIFAFNSSDLLSYISIILM